MSGSFMEHLIKAIENINKEQDKPIENIHEIMDKIAGGRGEK